MTISSFVLRAARRALLAAALCSLAMSSMWAAAQAGALSVDGTIVDPSGNALAKAAVKVSNDTTGAAVYTTADAQGHFSVAGLPTGRYTVEATASGFASSKQQVVVVAEHPATVALALQVGQATDEISVDASATKSIAAALAPMDALLNETSARTEITQSFLSNFTSPVADFGEAVQEAPATFTLNGNGVGLGQSKTYFRGFPDGEYDIDFDGIPFYDTNTPTHHSWAFFPTQFLGGIDFDRSPGTASTIGPTPFGGSIHLLSKDLSPLNNVRATFSGGSFNTYLYDAAYDSGSFGPGKKFNTTIDVHHLQSHGYQSLNNQTRNAGAIKFQYKLSDRTILTGFSAVIWLDANTPNFNATRCQMYGVSSVNAYSCSISGNILYPYTGAGINFLLTNNSNPLLYLNDEYNYYHVPTDFEYVGLHKEMSHDIVFDFKPYTYNYDNSEKYANSVAITDLPAASFLAGPQQPVGTYLGLKVTPCNTQPVNKSGVAAYACGVDKYNSYRKYGETSQVTQVSKFGILRAGFWYEWANTNRHQYPSDPTHNWADSALPNFAETFVTDSYQPFAEYELHATSKLSLTPGVKFAYYTIGTKQFADNGGKIGALTATPATANPNAFVANGGSYFATLPSLSINYRLKSNWSAYAQAAQGSIVPPSSVFDFSQGTSGAAIPVAMLPKQQKNTTYQFGTVLKSGRLTFDTDYYYIHFDNSYSSISSPNVLGGEPQFFVQPSSVTKGLEAESNIYFAHGLSLYLNGSYDSALYHGILNAACVSGATGCIASTPQLAVNAPSGLNVQNTPGSVFTEGMTYQHKDYDIGIFNKRVGTFYIDNGAYHNQYTVDAFNTVNAFFNYTIRGGGRFDQTKLRLSFNNVFNSSNVTGITLANGPVTQTIAANGTTYTDPFNTNGITPISGQDNVMILPGRSIALTVTFGLAPSRR